MAFENPLTDLRMLVGTALTDYAPLVTAIGGLNNIQIWDRTNDIRGDLAKSKRAKQRMMMRPVRSTLACTMNSSSFVFQRRYQIFIFSNDVKVAPIEYYEWLLWKSFAFLYENHKPGTSTAIDVPSPLIVDSIVLTEADPELEIDVMADNWINVCDSVVSGSVARASLVS